MSRIATRLYLTAMSILMFLELFLADPWTAGLPVSPAAFLVSLISSLPVIAFTILLLGWIRYLQASLLLSWLMFIVFTGLLAFLPSSMVSWVEYSRLEWSMIFPGLFCAYGAVLFHAVSLNNLFHSFQQENELYPE